LLHYPSHEGKGKVQIVGTIFRKENYGILFRPNSAAIPMRAAPFVGFGRPPELIVG
jgi:hypothetical protein